MSRPSRIERKSVVAQLAIALALVAMTVATGGCQEYLERSDTMTLGVADATETNKAIQTITRWPKASRQDRWVSDGQRANAAMVRYHAGKAAAPKGLSGKAGAAAGDASGADAGAQPAAPSVEK
jgi:hypothetical protein